jgi:hypothetical protein
LREKNLVTTKTGCNAAYAKDIKEVQLSSKIYLSEKIMHKERRLKDVYGYTKL